MGLPASLVIGLVGELMMEPVQREQKFLPRWCSPLAGNRFVSLATAGGFTGSFLCHLLHLELSLPPFPREAAREQISAQPLAPAPRLVPGQPVSATQSTPGSRPGLYSRVNPHWCRVKDTLDQHPPGKMQDPGGASNGVGFSSAQHQSKKIKPHLTFPGDFRGFFASSPGHWFSLEQKLGTRCSSSRDTLYRSPTSVVWLRRVVMERQPSSEAPPAH